MLKQCSSIQKDLFAVMKAPKEKKPVIECITNYVTIGDCANIILACGASPIMAEDSREIEEIVAVSGAVVLNIGTLQQETIDTMVVAGKKANELGIPVVLDPVGVGATKLRNDTAARLLDEIQLTAIRGNMSEIKALCGISSNTKGVDASDLDAVTLETADKAVAIVQSLAKKHNCTVCATGKIDIVASPQKVFIADNGHKMLEDVTGTGCMCSSVVGAYLGSGLPLPEAATLLATLTMCIAGELAQEYVTQNKAGIGTFRDKLFDYVYNLTEEDILKRGKIYEYIS